VFADGFRGRVSVAIEKKGRLLLGIGKYREVKIYHSARGEVSSF